MFIPRKRLHNHTKYQGSGIGLANCRKIVERQGGSIWVVLTGTGKGSKFGFTLPAGQQHQPSEQVQPSRDRKTASAHDPVYG
ncbi:MAG: hypothetical protein JSU63_00840 [Phycisphaerales bacterium]|nr:MAG: hypothetical protein JSU63_00840 [Phycisphaerales bacterium]